MSLENCRFWAPRPRNPCLSHRDRRLSGALEPQPIMVGHRLAELMAENVGFWRFQACASAMYVERGKYDAF